PGVTAGKAAEMEVVAVPSLPKQSHLYTAADEVINSLLDLQLEKWGLPPFADCKS
ncbi:pseudouridine-5'-monophosphatase-like, partial [Trifolium medium]|nr:pseudouridine-5'-monophosphatase-like [Trifolium medium]